MRKKQERKGKNTSKKNAGEKKLKKKVVCKTIAPSQEKIKSNSERKRAKDMANK